ncbi:hypothetical protein ABZ922_40985 [Streptomyces shenzhenensis]|uniref:hypothetical protein n=1 Tax=Streptomyces shenzhenensis TaxID=943815 RepID=UPI00340E322C
MITGLAVGAVGDGHRTVYGPVLVGVPMDLERALVSRQLTLAASRAGQLAVIGGASEEVLRDGVPAHVHGGATGTVMQRPRFG